MTASWLDSIPRCIPLTEHAPGGQVDVAGHGALAAYGRLHAVSNSGGGHQERHLCQEDEPGVTRLSQPVHRTEQTQLAAVGRSTGMSCVSLTRRAY